MDRTMSHRPAKNRSRADQFVLHSILPTIGSSLATAAAVIVIVGTNTVPALIPHRIAIPLFVAIALILMASIAGVVGQNSSRRVFESERVAALRRIAAGLRSRETTGANQFFDRVSLDLAPPGMQPKSMTVELYVSSSEFHSYRTTIVGGGAGAGKSTLMARLAIKMAEDTLNRLGTTVPLFASASTWEPGTHLSRWVEMEMQRSFGVRRRVTNVWLHSARAVLFVDGLDELPRSNGGTEFFEELRKWQSRPSGGKLVVSFRDTDNAAFLGAAVALKADRVARIRPVDRRLGREILAKILKESDVFSRASSDERLKLQIDFLIRSSREVTALHIRALAEGSTRFGEIEKHRNLADQVWIEKILRADENLIQGDSEGAVRGYLQVSQEGSSEVAARAGMRASLVMAGMGNEREAKKSFIRALNLFDDLNPYVHFDLGRSMESLNRSERLVLRLLEASRPLIEEEVFVATGMSPSETTAALKGLIGKGLASMQEVGKQRVGFYEAAIKPNNSAVRA